MGVMCTLQTFPYPQSIRTFLKNNTNLDTKLFCAKVKKGSIIMEGVSDFVATFRIN